MKKILFLVLMNCFTVCIFGQIDFDKYTITFSGDPDNMKTKPIALIVFQPDNRIYTIGLERQDVYSAGRDTAFEAQFSRGSSILEILDSSAVHFLVHGITKTNAKDYEFRVIENKGKVLAEWQTIGQFAADSVKIRDFERGMGY